jgi:hypothetical protein
MNFIALGMSTAILFYTIIEAGVVSIGASRMWSGRIACAIVVPIEALHYWLLHASLLSAGKGILMDISCNEGSFR